MILICFIHQVFMEKVTFLKWQDVGCRKVFLQENYFWILPSTSKEQSIFVFECGFNCLRRPQQPLFNINKSELSWFYRLCCKWPINKHAWCQEADLFGTVLLWYFRQLNEKTLIGKSYFMPFFSSQLVNLERLEIPKIKRSNFSKFEDNFLFPPFCLTSHQRLMSEFDGTSHIYLATNRNTF